MFENNVHLIIVVEIAVTLISSKIRENLARIVKRKQEYVSRCHVSQVSEKLKPGKFKVTFIIQSRSFI